MKKTFNFQRRVMRTKDYYNLRGHFQNYRDFICTLRSLTDFATVTFIQISWSNFNIKYRLTYSPRNIWAIKIFYPQKNRENAHTFVMWKCIFTHKRKVAKFVQIFTCCVYILIWIFRWKCLVICCCCCWSCKKKIFIWGVEWCAYKY